LRKKKFLAKTPRAREALYQPVTIAYALLLATHCFMMLLVLLYSTVTPLLLPIALLYFVSAWLFEKYTIIFNSDYSRMGGVLWVPTFRLMGGALIAYTLIMIVVFAGTAFVFGIVVSAICAVVAICFTIYVDMSWRDIGMYGSAQYLFEHPTVPIDSIQSPNQWPTEFAYVHPSLLPIVPEERLNAFNEEDSPKNVQAVRIERDPNSNKLKKSACS